MHCGLPVRHLGVLGPVGQGCGTGDFAIYVAPGVIAKSANCTWVTIHTNVPLNSVLFPPDALAPAAVVADKVVTIDHMFADDCGNLVAKLKFADVIGVVKAPAATVKLTLTREVPDPDAPPIVLSASETVPVKD